jgi:hypothetical protein
MRRLTILLAIAVLSALAAPAAEGGVKLKRHEGEHWVWYGPKGWVAAEGFAGIDITSPDSGRKHVGQGFSGTAFPVTHSEVVSYLIQTGGLDVHPLRNVTILSSGQPFAFGGGQRQVFRWRAFRKDLKHRTRGVLKVDVVNDDARGVYGFATTVYNAPKRRWKRVRRLLTRISKLIFYKPQNPPSILDWL